MKLYNPKTKRTIEGTAVMLKSLSIKGWVAVTDTQQVTANSEEVDEHPVTANSEEVDEHPVTANSEEVDEQPHDDIILIHDEIIDLEDHSSDKEKTVSRSGKRKATKNKK